MSEAVDITVEVDIRQAKSALADLEVSAKGLSSALATAFTGLTLQGKDLSTVITQLGLRLSNLALTAALKPLETGLTSLLSSAASGIGFAKGGVIEGGAVKPFARGGVVAAPTYFPLSTNGASFGLMGESGAEAILPLTRGADGSLGVRQMEGAGRAQVTVNVATTDLAAFRRSDTYLSGVLARAVTRAQRGA